MKTVKFDLFTKYILIGISFFFSFLTGDFLKSWTGIQVNVSNTSISLSWTAPPSFFLGRSSVQKYLILNTTSSAGIYQAQWLLADETNLTLSGLKPFTNYSLIVVAIASDQSRRGNTGWIHVQTDEGGTK